MTHTSKHRHLRNGIVSNDIEKIKMAIANAGKHAKGKAEEVVYDSIDSLKEKTLNAQDAVETFVAEKPLKALGIALVAGAFLGLLLRRK